MYAARRRRGKDLFTLYPVYVRTRKSAGLITLKLSVIESQNRRQSFGTFSVRKVITAALNSGEGGIATVVR
jgi:hypothetical protein